MVGTVGDREPVFGPRLAPLVGDNAGDRPSIDALPDGTLDEFEGFDFLFCAPDVDDDEQVLVLGQLAFGLGSG